MKILKSLVLFIIWGWMTVGFASPIQFHHAAIAKLRASGGSVSSPGTTGLAAWWKLNDAASPSVWQDAHSGNYDLDKYGGVVSTTGVVDGGADFDGSSGFLESYGVPVFHTANFTFGMRVNFDTFGTSVVLGGRCGNSSGGYQAYFQRTAGNLITAVVQATGYSVAPSDTTYSSSGWHSIVMVRESSILTLYIDGVAQADTEPISGTEQTDPQAFWLGYGASTFFDGKMDDVFIYTRALTPTEITFLHTNSYDDL